MSRHHDRLNWRRWAATRRRVFERDKYRCRVCGKPGRLEGHHQPPLKAGADPYDVDGIITTCRDCHLALHRSEYMVPGQEDWLKFVSELLE